MAKLGFQRVELRLARLEARGRVEHRAAGLFRLTPQDRDFVADRGEPLARLLFGGGEIGEPRV